MCEAVIDAPPVDLQPLLSNAFRDPSIWYFGLWPAFVFVLRFQYLHAYTNMRAHTRHTHTHLRTHAHTRAHTSLLRHVNRFDAEAGEYYAVVAAGLRQGGGGNIFLYSSPNLVAWTFHGLAFEGPHWLRCVCRARVRA